MPVLLQGTQGDTITGRAGFDTSDNIVGFLGDEDSADLLLPDRVVVLSYLGRIAVTRLECFF
jgi:hypothetical protein